MTIILFVLLGIAVGGFGTLIGAGGGFLLTPILLICFLSMPAQEVTAISMITVLFNSSSGSCAYAFMRRIDYKTGIMFAVATIPGSIIGTMVTQIISRNVFNILFGIYMLIFAILIFVKSRMGDHCAPVDHPGRFRTVRRLVDYYGQEAAFSFNLLAGILISIFVGFLSGLLGIGGGIVHVPALVLLGFPAHFATATSHFVLAFSSITSVLVHISDGSLTKDISMALSIGCGAVVGAQIGARISKHIKGSVIMICLAVALILAGGRILLMGIF